MSFVAFDLHKQMTEAVLVSADGAVVHRQRFPTTRGQMLAFARRHLTPEDVLAVEATFNTWPVVELVRPFVREVVVSNPLRTRAIAEAKVKTDKVDAFVLATLLRLDYLPSIWIPDPQTQLARRVSTERAALTADRTRIKNRIHAILHQRLLDAPVAGLFSAAGLRWLEGVELDPQGRVALDRQLRLLAQIESELLEIHNSVARQAYDDPNIKLAMTLPGFDFAVAQCVLAALGDIHRFPSGDRAASYLGIVPSTRQSGAHCYHGPITKQGCSHARWMVIQAAQHLATHPGPLGVFFRRLAKKKNRNVAVVATARKLVTILWHMLRRNEPYRYSIPKTTQAKFDRLRIRATGERRTGGCPQGSPRPAAYGTGHPTRAVPALDQVYAGNQLPAVAPLPPGEQAMLEREGLTRFVQEIQTPKRVPKRPRPPVTK
jgi:transposase